MEKVIITGSSGFIGSALKNKLLASGGYAIASISHNELLDQTALTKLVEDAQPNYIFHLAAYGNHSTQIDDQETFNANVVGTFNLLQATKNVRYKAFLNFGSSSEYGKKSTPMSETDLPEALTMYGCSKVAGTYLARAFAKKYDKPIITVRPFSVFGPGEADHRFIPTVVKKLLFNEAISLETTAKHDWIYIDDFLDALGLIADATSLLSGQIINIGTGREATNAEVVAMLEIASNKKAKIKKAQGLRLNDSQVWQADISKLANLNWHPKHPLPLALLRTFLYYKTKYYGN